MECSPKDTAGTVNGVKDGTVPTPDQDKIINISLNSGDAGVHYNFAEIAPSSLSGYASVLISLPN